MAGESHCDSDGEKRAEDGSRVWGQSAEAPWLSHWGRTPMSQCHGEPVGPRLHRERCWDLLRMAEVQGARLPAGVKRPLPFFAFRRWPWGWLEGGRVCLNGTFETRLVTVQQLKCPSLQ